MKTFFAAIISISILALAAQEVELKQSSYRLRLHIPFTEYADLTAAWIQVDACAENGVCDKSVDRIDLRDLAAAPQLKLNIDRQGRVEVTYAPDKDATPLVLARSKVENGWIPALELCRSEGVTLKCSAKLTRDESSHAYSLKVEAR